MGHASFDSDIEAIASLFERTAQAMEGVVSAYIDQSITAEQAEAAIELLAGALKREVIEQVADVIPRAYSDGVAEALRIADSPGPIDPEDHEAMSSLSQRRLERRLSHAAEGLAIDALDKLDEAVEQRLAPLKSEEALP